MIHMHARNSYARVSLQAVCTGDEGRITDCQLVEETEPLGDPFNLDRYNDNRPIVPPNPCRKRWAHLAIACRQFEITGVQFLDE